MPHLQTRSAARTVRPAHAGFSFVELLIVLTLAGLLLSMAVPAFAGFLAIQRSNSTISRFVASLHLARGEAIKRNARAVVCKSADGLSCSSQGGWEQGWIVFHDANNNAQVDSEEQIVARSSAIAEGFRLSGNKPVSNYVSYSANGSAKLLSGAFQAGSFTLCVPPGSGIVAQKVILSGTGRPRVQPGLAGDCD